MTPRPPRTAAPVLNASRGTSHHRAFTLIEMLVVISIISLLITVTFPVIRVTLQSTAVNAAAGQVNNSLSAARVYATRNRSFVAARRVGATLRTAQDNGDGYSGTIVLFAPDNSLRVMENDQNAFDPVNLPASAGWLELQVPPLNGYTPVADLEDIRFPGRVQMLGIVRTGDGPFDVQLLPPPFAIRFGADGSISQGSDDDGLRGSDGGMEDWDRVVYVSETGNSRLIGRGPNAIEVTDYDVTNERGDFADADPVQPGIQLDLGEFGRQGELLMDDGRVQLPFSSVETVSGVLVLEPRRVPAQFRNPEDGTQVALNYDRERLNVYTPTESAAILNWASERPTFARILLFNRYTGQDLSR